MRIRTTAEAATLAAGLTMLGAGAALAQDLDGPGGPGRSGVRAEAVENIERSTNAEFDLRLEPAEGNNYDVFITLFTEEDQQLTGGLTEAIAGGDRNTSRVVINFQPQGQVEDAPAGAVEAGDDPGGDPVGYVLGGVVLTGVAGAGALYARRRRQDG